MSNEKRNSLEIYADSYRCNRKTFYGKFGLVEDSKRYFCELLEAVTEEFETVGRCRLLDQIWAEYPYTDAVTYAVLQQYVDGDTASLKKIFGRGSYSVYIPFPENYQIKWIGREKAMVRMPARFLDKVEHAGQKRHAMLLRKQQPAPASFEGGIQTGDALVSVSDDKRIAAGTLSERDRKGSLQETETVSGEISAKEVSEHDPAGAKERPERSGGQTEEEPERSGEQIKEESVKSREQAEEEPDKSREQTMGESVKSGGQTEKELERSMEQTKEESVKNREQAEEEPESCGEAAEKEADRIRKEAREEADRILENALEEAARIRSRALQEKKNIFAEAELEKNRILESAHNIAESILQNAKEQAGEESRAVLQKMAEKYITGEQERIRRECSREAAMLTEETVREYSVIDDIHREMCDRTDLLQGNIVREIDFMKGLLDAIKGEMFTHLNAWQKSLYPREYKPIAMRYQDLYRILNVQGLITKAILGIESAVIEQGEAKSPVGPADQGGAQIVEGLRKLQRNLDIFLRGFERALNGLDLYVYIPQPGEAYDEALHKCENEEDYPDHGAVIDKCIVPGINKGKPGTAQEIIVPAVVGIRRKEDEQ